MKKRVIAVGVLAGGITLTGLAGSAYAADTSSSASHAPATAKRKDAGAVVCVVGKADAKSRKVLPPSTRPGEAADAPGWKPAKPAKEAGQRVQSRTAPAETGYTKVIRGARGTVHVGPLPAGVRCVKVAPGAEVPAPTR
jgi:hypothetical protein